MEQTGPVEKEERLSAVDMLRGCALLGILLMNIQDFGLPEAAYENPLAWGGATGANLAYWWANQVFFEGKMRFLFSLLFGAGVVLLTDRAVRRGAGLTTADIYLRRNLWLIVLGLLHAYLLWAGDILFPYGVAGVGLFVFRVLSPRRLLWAAGIVFVLINLAAATILYSQFETRDQGVAAAKVAEGQRTKEQKAQFKAYQKMLDNFDAVKNRAKIEETIRKRREGYGANLLQRAPNAFSNQTSASLIFILLDVAFPMLLGMSFYKSGILNGCRPWRFYAALAAAGYLLGIPPLNYVTREIVASGFDPWVLQFTTAAYEYGRLSVGLGHLGLLLLVYRLGWLAPLRSLLARTGQMALTNYLLTSALMTLFFNGYGLGKFATLERHQLLYLVAAMWSINLILSPLWLRYFRFGPVEWAWRSLTYWQKQPFRIASNPTGEDLPPSPLAA